VNLQGFSSNSSKSLSTMADFTEGGLGRKGQLFRYSHSRTDEQSGCGRYKVEGSHRTFSGTMSFLSWEVAIVLLVVGKYIAAQMKSW